MCNLTATNFHTDETTLRIKKKLLKTLFRDFPRNVSLVKRVNMQSPLFVYIRTNISFLINP